MKERNKFLEIDGLFWESETHEWFYDKTSTNYATTKNVNGISLPNIMCFVVRKKETGEYDRVIMDSETNEIIFSSGNLEEIGAHIDMLKVAKAFGV